MTIQTVAIVGVGLIGGSFALAIRSRGFMGEILGVSSPKTIEAALRRGAIDRAAPLEQATAAADLIYLAQPIERIVEALPRVAAAARPHSLTTDAGSTKAVIAARAAEVFREGPWFAGGHPMAGKEARGVENADADLFQDATYVLSPAGGAAPPAPVFEEFVQWLQRIGARPVFLDAEQHDRIVARTSHLPQLLSSALAFALARDEQSLEPWRVSGSGLRDMTRLAQSPYEIWRDIFATNRENVQEAIGEFQKILDDLRRALAEDSLEESFRIAQRSARHIASDSRE